MRVHGKPMLIALTATVLLALAGSDTSASNFSFREKNFELVGNEALGASKTKAKITLAGRAPVECKITLLGRFSENTIRKETGVGRGTINHSEIESCSNGTATIRNETMPWGIRYRSFTGTLPRIRTISLSLIGVTVRIKELGGIECELASTLSRPVGVILGAGETGLETTGEPENATFEGSERIPLEGEGFLCALTGEAQFGGTMLLRNLPRTATIRISLI